MSLFVIYFHFEDNLKLSGGFIDSLKRLQHYHCNHLTHNDKSVRERYEQTPVF